MKKLSLVLVALATASAAVLGSSIDAISKEAEIISNKTESVSCVEIPDTESIIAGILEDTKTDTEATTETVKKKADTTKEKTEKKKQREDTKKKVKKATPKTKEIIDTEAAKKKAEEKQKAEEKKKEIAKKKAKDAKDAVAKVVIDGELTEEASWKSYEDAKALVGKLTDGDLKTHLEEQLDTANKALFQAEVIENSIIDLESLAEPELQPWEAHPGVVGTNEPVEPVNEDNSVDFSSLPNQGTRVSMTPIENHSRVSDLTPEEQAVYYAYKASFTDATFLQNEDVIVASANLSSGQFDILGAVIRDELFPYQWPSNYFGYCDMNDDGITDVVANTFELYNCFVTNRNYLAAVQSWAKDIVSPNMDEMTAFYTIADGIINHLTYSQDADEAKWAVDGHYGNCIVYACLLKDMCNAVGIDCRIDAGWATDSLGTGLHEWNVVTIDGAQYYSDLCWADTDRDTYETYALSSSLWSNHRSDRRYE